EARSQDIPAIIDVMRRAYPDMPVYTPGNIQGQIAAFAEGQFVAQAGEEIVGYAATFRIDEAMALKPHTWVEITGQGYASRHDPAGEWLYAMEVCVDPAWRGRRVGQRLYEARKRLVERLDLKGIVFGGRLPGLSRRMKQFGSAEAYLDAVKARQIRDQVATFQINNGFEPIGLLPDYLPSDKESLGYAAHMVWRNPYADPSPRDVPHSARPKDWVRVAVVQFQQRAVLNFAEFVRNVEFFVDVVSDYNSDFAVFPELFTLQLLAFEDHKLPPAEAIDRLTTHTQALVDALHDMAVRYNINIIGGSHPTRSENGDINNVAYICLRDGSVHT